MSKFAFKFLLLRCSHILSVRLLNGYLCIGPQRCIEKKYEYMHLLHFKPTDGCVGDIIPFYDDGEYHVFYLKRLEGLNDSSSPAFRRLTSKVYKILQLLR